MNKILVTGATGFLGSHVRRIVTSGKMTQDFIFVGSKRGDLTNFATTMALLDDVQPDIVMHLAALSGGIGDNRARPADFYFINSLIVSNMFEACARKGVKRIIYTMGGCSYPGTAGSPISEDEMWNGYPQGDSAAYSSAKKMGIVAAQAYAGQYGIRSDVFIPGNLYGEFDNFHLEKSHVIPALVRKFVEATEAKQDTVTMWGTGSPIRDFVYAEDVARILLDAVARDDLITPMNLSSGTGITIRSLAELIAAQTGFEGALVWDTDKPDGQAEKIFGVQRMKDHGFSCDTELSVGIMKTISWFRETVASSGSIRL